MKNRFHLIKRILISIFCFILFYSCYYNRNKTNTTISIIKAKSDSAVVAITDYYSEKIETFRAYLEFSSLAYNLIISQNTKLLSFHENLNSDTVAGKKQVLEYLFYHYPIIIPGNKGKMIHHHRFNVLDSSKINILKEKVLVDDEEFDSYKLNFIDYKCFEIGEYDNIRYTWWNPYVENYRDPKYFQGMSTDYYKNPNIEESGMVAIVNYFKVTMDRSTENISRLFKLFKTPFFLLVGKEMYLDLKIDVTVNSLIIAHDYFLKKDYQGLVDFLQQKHFGDMNQSRVKQSSAWILGEANSSWYYTFWERRSTEKNDDSVYSMLKEIQSNYN